MKFYYAKGTCALGIHILLEETGVAYEPHRLDFAKQEQRNPGYLAINPKGKVPLVQFDDGSTLSEFQAIATWLHLTRPDKRLLPADPLAAARAYELMDYTVGTVHGLGFSRISRPQNYSPAPESHEAVKAAGLATFEQGMAWLGSKASAEGFAVGDFSLADAALFYVEFWMAERLNKPLPGHLANHYARMKDRPSVQKVLKMQGFA